MMRWRVDDAGTWALAGAVALCLAAILGLLGLLAGAGLAPLSLAVAPGVSLGAALARRLAPA